MKAGWELKALGEVCSFENGDRGENYPSKSVQTTTGVPFINAGHLSEFGLDFETMNYIPRERFDLLGNGKIRKDDILFCLRGSLGKFASVGDLSEGAIASSLVIVRPKEAAINAFVSAYFQSDLCASMIDKYKNGAAQPNLSAASLKNFIIPIPPLPEQQRIVTILDEAFDCIATAKANAEKNLQNARALFESHLQSVFTQRGEGWVDTTIGQQIRFIDYRGKTPEKTESGLRLITAKNVKMGYLQEQPMEFVAPESYDSWMTRGIPRSGDVLFTTEAPLANVTQLDTDEKVVFAQRIIIMQTDAAKLDSTFLKYLLLSQPVQQRIHAKGTGATVQGIKASLLKTIEISFPKSVGEQVQIVAKLDNLRTETQRLESIYQQKLTALDALKKSLLDQAFTGQL
jgi:type I restriction enzyme S subunit